ncbi:MAG: aminoglycoside phosphotransferase family protein [Chloroflexi bacterium]|nr:aminoglycoside phosphotransferase family protein [Chloroflexota bacterium]
MSSLSPKFGHVEGHDTDSFIRSTFVEHLIEANTTVRGAAGAAWLSSLPALIAECAQQWSLHLDAPFAYPSINYVAPAVRADGAAMVLKIRFPDREFRSEAEVLRLYDGCGITRLLGADIPRGALLLEQLRPGTLLCDIADDEQATAIAAGIMRKLWLPAPFTYDFPTVAGWLQHMVECAPALTSSTSHTVLASWIDRAVAIYRELAAAPAAHVLLHGDLHHYNILAAERDPWLAVDPFGVVGEPACEAGPWIMNRLPEPFDAGAARRITIQCVDQLAGALDIDRARLAAWSVVRLVLAAFWTWEDHGRGWDDVLACAEILQSIKG